jgi:hypothetical protein
MSPEISILLQTKRTSAFSLGSVELLFMEKTPDMAVIFL